MVVSLNNFPWARSLLNEMANFLAYICNLASFQLHHTYVGSLICLLALSGVDCTVVNKTNMMKNDIGPAASLLHKSMLLVYHLISKSVLEQVLLPDKLCFVKW